MARDEDKTPLRSWEKPTVRVMASGSAEFAGGGASDGSGGS
jgi:hypothetical protein